MATVNERDGKEFAIANQAEIRVNSFVGRMEAPMKAVYFAVVAVSFFPGCGRYCERDSVGDVSAIANSNTEQGKKKPIKQGFPKIDDIEEIYAEAYSHILSPIVKDIPQFGMPKQHYEKLIAKLQNVELDPLVRQDDHEFGSIRMTFKYGGTLRLCWFWQGQKNRLSYSLGSVRFRTVGDKFADDETIAFDAVVRGIYEKEVQHEEEQDSATEPESEYWPGCCCGELSLRHGRGRIKCPDCGRHRVAYSYRG